ncbi:MAG TPA: hypothetical protein PKE13_17280 [Hyphomicrobium zavarzinii]|nr:hypothetical protein [Hyphomicrobium zavarzinii]
MNVYSKRDKTQKKYADLPIQEPQVHERLARSPLERLMWATQVAADFTLPAASVRVAVYLAHMINAKTAAAWPAIQTIAAALTVSQSTVRNGLRSLESGGHLRIVLGGGRNRTNRYVAILKAEQKP